MVCKNPHSLRIFALVIILAGCFILLRMITRIFPHWSTDRATMSVATAPRFASPGKFHRNSPANPVVTVVTAYYDIPSKAPKTRYMKWIRNFLPRIPCYLYIFTSKASVAALRKIRKRYLNQTTFTVKEFNQLKEYSRVDLWKEQQSKDTEKKIHTPELYIVWNEKINMVMEAISANIFNSEYFIWCDIGSFRSKSQAEKLVTFASYNRTKSVLKDSEKMALLLIKPFAREDGVTEESGLPRVAYHDVARVGGTIMAGHREAWQIWNHSFYEMLELYLKNDRFAGKDQNVMNSVVVRNPERFYLVPPKPYFGGLGNRWFYFQYYFSEAVDQSYPEPVL